MLATLPDEKRQLELPTTGPLVLGRAWQQNFFETLLLAAPGLLNFISRSHLEVEAYPGAERISLTNISVNPVWAGHQLLPQGKRCTLAPNQVISFVRPLNTGCVHFLSLQVCTIEDTVGSSATVAPIIPAVALTLEEPPSPPTAEPRAIEAPTHLPATALLNTTTPRMPSLHAKRASQPAEPLHAALACAKAQQSTAPQAPRLQSWVAALTATPSDIKQAAAPKPPQSAFLPSTTLALDEGKRQLLVPEPTPPSTPRHGSPTEPEMEPTAPSPPDAGICLQQVASGGAHQIGLAPSLKARLQEKAHAFEKLPANVDEKTDAALNNVQATTDEKNHDTPQEAPTVADEESCGKRHDSHAMMDENSSHSCKHTQVTLELTGDCVLDEVPASERRIGPLSLASSALVVGRRHQADLHRNAVKKEVLSFISRDHFRISLEGSTFQLCALTPNPLYRFRDGKEPVELMSGEEVEIVSGDRIALGTGYDDVFSAAADAFRRLRWEFRQNEQESSAADDEHKVRLMTPGTKPLGFSGSTEDHGPQRHADLGKKLRHGCLGAMDATPQSFSCGDRGGGGNQHVATSRQVQEERPSEIWGPAPRLLSPCSAEASKALLPRLERHLLSAFSFDE